MLQYTNSESIVLLYKYDSPSGLNALPFLVLCTQTLGNASGRQFAHAQSRRNQPSYFFVVIVTGMFSVVFNSLYFSLRIHPRVDFFHRRNFFLSYIVCFDGISSEEVCLGPYYGRL